MNEITAAIATLSGLGVLFGLALAMASRKFCVKTDPRADTISAKLPGANCGACGQAGCTGFTESLIKGECTVERCPVSDLDTKHEIARLLGVELKVAVRQTAALHCQGGSRAKDKYSYGGILECRAAALVMDGRKACVYGCMGYGSCVAACAFGALSMGADGLPVVDTKKCTACGACVETCPKGLYSLIAETKHIIIACSSHAMGRDVMKVCSAGCIACCKCEKTCKAGAIRVIDNLAVIDYTKCTDCGECVAVCPTKVIVKRP